MSARSAGGKMGTSDDLEKSGRQPELAARKHRRGNPLKWLSRYAAGLGLLFILILFSVLIGLGFSSKMSIYGLPYSLETGRITVELLVIVMGVVFLLLLLVTLPCIMVLTYHTAAVGPLAKKIREDLFLCGITVNEDLDEHMKEFQVRNNFMAFAWPVLTLTIFLLVMWGFTIAPEGLTGLTVSLTQGTLPAGSGYYTFDSQKFFAFLADRASPITWMFLGAYFYSLTVLTGRWRRMDLTTGLFWTLNARMAIVLIVGLLLSKVWPDISAYVAFLAGITPEGLLDWLGDWLKDVLSAVSKERAQGIFRQRDLERKLKSISFWQAERLAEEGIESVEDLATQEIPTLLINTRFNTPGLLYWIDQALLLNQIPDEDADSFARAYIRTATDLFDLREPGVNKDTAHVCKSIADAQPADKAGSPITPGMLENLIGTLTFGPNLRFLLNYWHNVNDPRELSAQKASLRKQRAA
jgi:hypothetical protein